MSSVLYSPTTDMLLAVGALATLGSLLYLLRALYILKERCFWLAQENDKLRHQARMWCDTLPILDQTAD